MASTAEVAFDSARGFLNDTGESIWTNAVLLPFMKEAHGDLLLAMFLNGLPTIKVKTSTIQIPAAQTAFSDELPDDLVEPISIKERKSGSTQDWVPMTEVNFEPDVDRTEALRYWCWREEDIMLVGSTEAREVLLRYWASLTVIVDGNSSISIALAEFFLGPQCAAYAANSVGNSTLARELMYIAGVQTGIAGSKLNMIIQANVKGMQNLPARRIPYRRFARSRLLL